jgi:hypothetical protein
MNKGSLNSTAITYKKGSYEEDTKEYISKIDTNTDLDQSLIDLINKATEQMLTGLKTSYDKTIIDRDIFLRKTMLEKIYEKTNNKLTKSHLFDDTIEKINQYKCDKDLFIESTINSIKLKLLTDYENNIKTYKQITDEIDKINLQISNRTLKDLLLQHKPYSQVANSVWLATIKIQEKIKEGRLFDENGKPLDEKFVQQYYPKPLQHPANNGKQPKTPNCQIF